ncbi:MAG TPA: sulfur globule protein CV3, partial [Chromatiaceae bacterium]|nr:sulfur globule protein CV3 [Chromatiaceae bacterium]
MRKSGRLLLAATVVGATLLMSLPANAFWGPFSFMRWGGWDGWEGWGPGSGWGYPGYGWGYPGYGYGWGGYGYPYGGWGSPYGYGWG